MLWLPRIAIVFLVALGLFAGSHQPPEDESKPEGRGFFSGLVTDLNGPKLTVGRTLPGEAPESRSFQLTPGTKVDGKLKRNVRVTVQYASGEQGDVAIHIIVRPPAKKDGKS